MGGWRVGGCVRMCGWGLCVWMGVWVNGAASNKYVFYQIYYSKFGKNNFEIHVETRGYGYFKTCRLDLPRTELVPLTFGTLEFRPGI